MPNTDQLTKRSKYLQVAGEHYCTHLLVIDADEYVRDYDADWKQFRYNLDNDPRFELGLQGNTQYSHNIEYQAQPGNCIALARLIYRPGELEYRSHWLLFRLRDGSPTAYQDVGDHNTVRGITIVTDENLRTEDRIMLDVNYQWDLFLKEGELTLEQYNDPERKKKFADHIVWEWEATRKKPRPIQS